MRRAVWSHGERGYGMLVANKLNLVGEYHAESDSRRDAEKQFCRAKINSSNYWVEHEFPDSYEGGLPNLPGIAEADLMEYRGTHGAAMAIDKFDRLGDEAITVSTTPVNSAAVTVSAFNGKVEDLLRFAVRAKNGWRTSSTEEVNKAVRAVYEQVGSACRTYRDALRGAPPEKQLVAVRDFANSRIVLRDLVPVLAKAAGAPLTDDRDAAELAKYMRKQRSAFMGLGAGNSGLVGVWKIGNGHITDLKDGTSKVDVRRIHLVTREEFNGEFEVRQGQ